MHFMCATTGRAQIAAVLIGLTFVIGGPLFYQPAYGQGGGGDGGGNGGGGGDSGGGGAIVKELIQKQPPDQRDAAKEIFDFLKHKSYGDLLVLQYDPDICEHLDCKNMSPATVKAFVGGSIQAKSSEEQANASWYIRIVVTAGVCTSLLSLLVSLFVAWRRR